MLLMYQCDGHCSAFWYFSRSFTLFFFVNVHHVDVKAMNGLVGASLLRAVKATRVVVVILRFACGLADKYDSLVLCLSL